VNRIPCAASLSSTGVLYGLPPLQLKHSYPKSSAIINITFGRLLFAARAVLELNVAPAVAAKIDFKKLRRSIQLLRIIIVSKTLFLIFLAFITISRDLPFNFVIGIHVLNTVNNTIIGASIQMRLVTNMTNTPHE
jgi:hypothetical protein